MEHDSSYSPVLWGAVVIPIVSGTELFVDPQTRSSFDFFILGFFYVASIRYTLAVALGVYAHEDSLKASRANRSGIVLWICYFLMLVLCSLLVPGAAILGLTATIVIAVIILTLSITQSAVSRRSFSDTQENNTTSRLYMDGLLLIILAYEILVNDTPSFQGLFFAVSIFLLLDLRLSESAKSNMSQMFSSLKKYFSDSWNRTPV